MAHPPEVRRALRDRYVFGRLPLAEAAAGIGVAETTARQWKAAAARAGDDWDVMRSAATVSREGRSAQWGQLLDDFAVLFATAQQRLRNDKDIDAVEASVTLGRLSDAYAKLLAASARVSSPINKYSVGLDVLRALAQYIAAERPDLVESYAGLLEGFGATLGAVLGGGDR